MRTRNDLVIAVILLAVSILFIAMGTGIPSPQFNQKTIGAGVFPVIWESVLALLSLLYLMRTIKSIKKEKQEAAQPVERKRGHYNAFLFIIISLVGYLLLMPVIGYLVITFLYSFICVLVYGWENFRQNRRKGILTSIISALFISGASYLLFSRVLSVFLPEGLLI